MTNNNTVILIQPPLPKRIRRDYISVQIPLNLGYIASVLTECQAQVTIYDFVVTKYNTATFLKELAEKKPVIVGFGAVSCTIPFVDFISKQVKKFNPAIKTVLGGVHASALPGETLGELKGIDFVVIGEGEATIRELYKEILGVQNYKRVKGIAFRNGPANEIFMTPKRELISDLDTIVFPALHFFDPDKYRRAHVSRGFSRKDLNVMELLTSRGCPEECIFCAGSINYGRAVRFRSLDSVIKEIEANYRIRKIDHISIEDDTFTINKKLVFELGKYLKSKGISWNCNARVNTVSPDMLRTMAKNNCRKISFGIESGSQRILGLTKKNITIEQVISAFNIARKAGIRFLEANFILGSHPDEKIEDIRMTEGLIFRLKPDFITLTLMCPFPGTEVFALMNKAGLLPGRKNWLRFNLLSEKLPYKKLYHLSALELLHQRNYILKKYYASAGYLFRQMVNIRNIRELKYLLRLARYVVVNR